MSTKMEIYYHSKRWGQSLRTAGLVSGILPHVAPLRNTTGVRDVVWRALVRAREKRRLDRGVAHGLGNLPRGERRPLDGGRQPELTAAPGARPPGHRVALAR